MFPDKGRPFLQQRLRWSRNSYRTYFTAIWKGWLWRQPFICQLSVLRILLTPVTMGFAVTYLAVWVLYPQKFVAFIAVGWLLGSAAVAVSPGRPAAPGPEEPGLRGFRHPRRMHKTSGQCDPAAGPGRGSRRPGGSERR